MKAVVSLLDGITLKNPKAQLDLSFDEEHFIVEEKGNKGFKTIVAASYKIPLKNLSATLLTTEKEFLEQSKSVVGRGVAGGLIFGPAGMILGGMSGIGKKQKVKKNYIYIISYVSAENEIKNITFTMPMLMNGVTRKFDNLLKTKFTPIEKIDQNEFHL
ncbi:hypothetical protein [Sporosarcina psychrophila]|uniref:Uncharacterized protein n=1 Tax=Sporosarcina psychrophila TaxID=1476 RepID=A0ABV2K9R6_SPOPS